MVAGAGVGLAAVVALALGAAAGEPQAQSGQPAVEYQVPAADTAEAAVRRGEAELAQGRARTAEVDAHIALEHDARDADARYLLARALQQQGLPKPSLQAFTAAAALRPPSGEQLRLVALDYVLLKDDVDALHWLRLAVDLQPGNAEAWYSLGRVLWTVGDLPSAAQAFQRALSIDSGMARAENNLGLVYEAENEPEQALDAYRRAIALQRTGNRASEQPLLNVGKLLIEQGRADEALEPLREATAQAPADAACHEALGRAASAANLMPEAETEMRRAVELNPTNPRVHYELGRIYRLNGKAEAARVEFAASARMYGSRDHRE